jgi:transposase
MAFGIVRVLVVRGGSFRMIYRRTIRFTTGTGDGLRRAYWRPFTTASARWCALKLVEMRSRLRPSSIAKASNRPMSADQRATTRGKKINGRKRHLLVDVMGLLLVVMITAASVQDRDGAVPVLREARREYPTLQHVWADGVYNGSVIDNLAAETGVTIEMVKRSDDMRGFVVLPKRWVVERTFAWLCAYRLLSKEYERTLESSKADILYAMTSLMLKRLTTPSGMLDDA